MNKRNNSKENFESVDLEDVDVAYATHISRGEKFDIAPTIIVVISKRYDVVEVQDHTIALPSALCLQKKALCLFDEVV